MNVLPGDRFMLRAAFTVHAVSVVERGGVVWTEGGRSGFGELGVLWLRVYG